MNDTAQMHHYDTREFARKLFAYRNRALLDSLPLEIEIGACLMCRFPLHAVRACPKISLKKGQRQGSVYRIGPFFSAHRDLPGVRARQGGERNDGTERGAMPENG